MPAFIIRVELHGGSNDDYQRLYQVMQNNGFSAVIRGDDGKVYRLPPVEFLYGVDATIEQVRQFAADTAAQILPNPAILVTQAESVSWFGLQEVVQN